MNIYDIGYECMSVVVNYLDLISLVSLSLTSRFLREQVWDYIAFISNLEDSWEEKKDIINHPSDLIDGVFKLEDHMIFTTHDDHIRFINLDEYNKNTFIYKYMGEVVVHSPTSLRYQKLLNGTVLGNVDTLLSSYIFRSDHIVDYCDLYMLSKFNICVAEIRNWIFGTRGRPKTFATDKVSQAFFNSFFHIKEVAPLGLLSNVFPLHICPTADIVYRLYVFTIMCCTKAIGWWMYSHRNINMVLEDIRMRSFASSVRLLYKDRKELKKLLTWTTSDEIQEILLRRSRNNYHLSDEMIIALYEVSGCQYPKFYKEIMRGMLIYLGSELMTRDIISYIIGLDNPTHHLQSFVIKQCSKLLKDYNNTTYSGASRRDEVVKNLNRIVELFSPLVNVDILDIALIRCVETLDSWAQLNKIQSVCRKVIDLKENYPWMCYDEFEHQNIPNYEYLVGPVYTSPHICFIEWYKNKCDLAISKLLMEVFEPTGCVIEAIY